MQPRADDHNLDLATGFGRDGDVLFVELEQAQKVDKVALDKAQRAQIQQLAVLKVQAAQLSDFFADVTGVRRQIHAGCAAFEAVFDLCTGKLVQHRLHHGELVEVGVQ